MRASTWSRYSLYILATLVLVLAVSLRQLRRQHRQLVNIRATSLTRADSLAQRQNTQRAVALLYQALWADNHYTYMARTSTMAVYGNEKINTVASMIHAPQGYAITYLSGDPRGLTSGFNRRWSWRKASASAPLTAYATMQRNATDMVAARFARMLQNYSAMWSGQDKVGNRLADVVWISPFNATAGAHGPAKCLWIDAATKLTLRVKTFNYQMNPVMESTLSNINLHPALTAATFPIEPEMKQVVKGTPWMAQDMGDDGAAVKKLTGGLAPPVPKELPPGFVRESVGVHRISADGSPQFAAVARYTDGLNTLTMFALKAAPGAKGETGATNKMVQSCDFGPGTIVIHDTAQERLVAVSDLPIQTLYRVLGVPPNVALESGGTAATQRGH